MPDARTRWAIAWRAARLADPDHPDRRRHHELAQAAWRAMHPARHLGDLFPCDTYADRLRQVREGRAYRLRAQGLLSDGLAGLFTRPEHLERGRLKVQEARLFERCPLP